MSNAYAAKWSDDTLTVEVCTMPCWICGQTSIVVMPQEAWERFDKYDVHIATAWPAATHEQQVLLTNGTHLKCWDEEFKKEESET